MDCELCGTLLYSEEEDICLACQTALDTGVEIVNDDLGYVREGSEEDFDIGGEA